MYYRHTGYPEASRARVTTSPRPSPEQVLRRSVRGMLQHNKLGRAQLRKLKIYAGPEHPHEAQNPQVLEIKE